MDRDVVFMDQQKRWEWENGPRTAATKEHGDSGAIESAGALGKAKFGWVEKTTFFYGNYIVI